MQGYILKTQPVKDEDLLVWILTQNRLILAYRFYGARHANIAQGYKLDFELEQKMNFLPHLKGTMHLGVVWLHKREHLVVWQAFMRILWLHLKDCTECEEFYFNLLESCSLRFIKQNPLRVLLEGYLQLLDFEGRLAKEPICFICSKKINENSCSLARGFLLAHTQCLAKNSFNINELLYCFNEKNFINLTDNAIADLYHIMLEGL